MAKTLRVGVIGASAEQGWAKISHVPAIQQLDSLELAAVVTNDQLSADRAAKAFGAARGYGNANDLFADPDIDIVTVAVDVACLYAALRDDILIGTRTLPDFDHAVRMAWLVDDALAASSSGERIAALEWPRQ